MKNEDLEFSVPSLLPTNPRKRSRESELKYKLHQFQQQNRELKAMIYQQRREHQRQQIMLKISASNSIKLSNDKIMMLQKALDAEKGKTERSRSLTPYFSDDSMLSISHQSIDDHENTQNMLYLKDQEIQKLKEECKKLKEYEEFWRNKSFQELNEGYMEILDDAQRPTKRQRVSMEEEHGSFIHDEFVPIHSNDSMDPFSYSPKYGFSEDEHLNLFGDTNQNDFF